MMPHEDALKPAGKTVLEVLELKHPDQTEPHAHAFVECDELPILLEVTVTEEHIHKTAHKLSGSAGPSGADSMLWQSILLLIWKSKQNTVQSNSYSYRKASK